MSKDEMRAELEQMRQLLAHQGVVDIEAFAELFDRMGEQGREMVLAAIKKPTTWGLGFDEGTELERLYYRSFGRESFLATREQVKQYSRQLQDRRIHPERFAFFLSGIPEADRGEILQIAAGNQPGLIGTAIDPGADPQQDNLLRGSFMTDEEFGAYEERRTM